MMSFWDGFEKRAISDKLIVKALHSRAARSIRSATNRELGSKGAREQVKLFKKSVTPKRTHELLDRHRANFKNLPPRSAKRRGALEMVKGWQGINPKPKRGRPPKDPFD